MDDNFVLKTFLINATMTHFLSSVLESRMYQQAWFNNLIPRHQVNKDDEIVDDNANND
ncbi:hypothetical protein [Candidatus Nitrosocosmicus franklandus]|uniref:hypothetical protein n=1 Tax=Candidatus Nitrosocosmicus franklandianus TaxID=1798806 RepID=UPI0015598A07|nr:hypothetical protein [Candidatus Nitrosocosmicus franklandus]